MTLYVTEYRETFKRAFPINKACVCSVPQSPASPTSSAVAGGLCNTELPGNPKSKLKCYPLGRVQLFANPWTVAHQAALFMNFSRKEYWSGFLNTQNTGFPSPGNLPDPGPN